MTTQYQVVFMPYLALGGRDCISIADVDIWNFARGHASVDAALAARVGELLAMYRQNGRDSRSSAPLRNIGIVAVGTRDFRLISDSDLLARYRRPVISYSCAASHTIAFRTALPL